VVREVGAANAAQYRVPASAAKQDGILRSHLRHSDGSLRDTVVYSIIESEWPAVKTPPRFKLEGGPR